MDILKKESFPVHYISGTQNYHSSRDSLPTASRTFYFKLPYIGRFSVITQKKIRHFIKRNDLDIKHVWFERPYP